MYILYNIIRKRPSNGAHSLISMYSFEEYEQRYHKFSNSIYISSASISQIVKTVKSVVDNFLNSTNNVPFHVSYKRYPWPHAVAAPRWGGGGAGGGIFFFFFFFFACQLSGRSSP